jgi:hypothetical protein
MKNKRGAFQVAVKNINKVTEDAVLIRSLEEVGGPIVEFDRPLQFHLGYAFVKFANSDRARELVERPPSIKLDGRHLFLEKFEKGKKNQKAKQNGFNSSSNNSKNPTPPQRVSARSVGNLEISFGEAEESVPVVTTAPTERRVVMKPVGASALQKTLARLSVEQRDERKETREEEEERERREREALEQRLLEEQREYAKREREKQLREQAAQLLKSAEPPGSALAAAGARSFCGGCGELNVPGFTFCNFCGLKNGEVPKLSVVAPVVAAPLIVGGAAAAATTATTAAPPPIVIGAAAAPPPPIVVGTSAAASASAPIVAGAPSVAAAGGGAAVGGGKSVAEVLALVQLEMYAEEFAAEKVREASQMLDSNVVARMKPFHRKKLERILSQLRETNLI